MKTHLLLPLAVIRPMRLTDDGTLDTVLICEECELEVRYNFASADENAYPEGEQGYAEFVQWAINDADETHDCPVIQEGDIN